MKKILYIVIFSGVGLFASNGLSIVKIDRDEVVKLSSKNSSCLIDYTKWSNFLSNTSCLHLNNSHNKEIFCTKDKKMCKKASEVIFYAFTKEDLTKVKIPQKAPFYGKRFYNFMGGSGTNESIYIDKKGIVYSTFSGIYSQSTKKVGTYKKFLEHYFIYKDVICSQEHQGTIECSYLSK